jgi:hypothetical protein
MAKFLTRVELHGATGADYERLHEEMAKQNFSRTIPADDGARYHLPTAEYYSHGDLTAEAVRGLADVAIAATGKAAWVLTVRWDVASWRLAKA